jgi:hypothetical protein
MLNSHHNTLGNQADLKEALGNEHKTAHRYIVVYVPVPVCMECGLETRDMYPICNTCAEDL